MLGILIPLMLSVAADRLERADELAGALVATAPAYLDDLAAREHAAAALAAELPEVPAELLLAVAWVESRYTPATTSRLRDGVRRTGVPRWQRPPRGVSGPFFCGVTQARARHSWPRCLELRDVREGYAAGAAELADWRRICRRMRARDVTRCALGGHVAGVAGARRGGGSYADRVLHRLHRLRRELSDDRRATSQRG